MTDHNSRVRTAILDHALRGRPVTISSLAAATGLARDGVKSVLTILHEAGAVHLRDGAVVAAYPFSLVPTAHRVTIGGVTAYANCAIDALAVPPMAGGAARITSTCGHCRGPIAVTMQAHRVLESQPAAPVVFYLAKDCCAPGPAVLTRCPTIHASHADILAISACWPFDDIRRHPRNVAPSDCFGPRAAGAERRVAPLCAVRPRRVSSPRTAPS